MNVRGVLEGKCWACVKGLKKKKKTSLEFCPISCNQSHRRLSAALSSQVQNSLWQRLVAAEVMDGGVQTQAVCKNLTFIATNEG